VVDARTGEVREESNGLPKENTLSTGRASVAMCGCDLMLEKPVCEGLSPVSAFLCAWLGSSVSSRRLQVSLELGRFLGVTKCVPFKFPPRASGSGDGGCLVEVDVAIPLKVNGAGVSSLGRLGVVVVVVEVAVVVEAAVSCVTAAAGCSNGALQALVSVVAFALALLVALVLVVFVALALVLMVAQSLTMSVKGLAQVLLVFVELALVVSVVSVVGGRLAFSDSNSCCEGIRPRLTHVSTKRDACCSCPRGIHMALPALSVPISADEMELVSESRSCASWGGAGRSGSNPALTSINCAKRVIKRELTSRSTNWYCIPNDSPLRFESPAAIRLNVPYASGPHAPNVSTHTGRSWNSVVAQTSS
jgi:hypothetical protein